MLGSETDGFLPMPTPLHPAQPQNPHSHLTHFKNLWVTPILTSNQDGNSKCATPCPPYICQLWNTLKCMDISNRIEAGLLSTPIQHWNKYIPWMESDFSRKGNERRNLQSYITFMCHSLLDHRKTNLSPEPPWKEMDSQKFWPRVWFNSNDNFL